MDDINVELHNDPQTGPSYNYNHFYQVAMDTHPAQVHIPMAMDVRFICFGARLEKKVEDCQVSAVCSCM